MGPATRSGGRANPPGCNLSLGTARINPQMDSHNPSAAFDPCQDQDERQAYRDGQAEDRYIYVSPRPMHRSASTDQEPREQARHSCPSHRNTVPRQCQDVPFLQPQAVKPEIVNAPKFAHYEHDMDWILSLGSNKGSLDNLRHTTSFLPQATSNTDADQGLSDEERGYRSGQWTHTENYSEYDSDVLFDKVDDPADNPHLRYREDTAERGISPYKEEGDELLRVEKSRAYEALSHAPENLQRDAFGSDLHTAVNGSRCEPAYGSDDRIRSEARLSNRASRYRKQEEVPIHKSGVLDFTGDQSETSEEDENERPFHTQETQPRLRQVRHSNNAQISRGRNADFSILTDTSLTTGNPSKIAASTKEGTTVVKSLDNNSHQKEQVLGVIARGDFAQVDQDSGDRNESLRAKSTGAMIRHLSTKPARSVRPKQPEVIERPKTDNEIAEQTPAVQREKAITRPRRTILPSSKCDVKIGLVHDVDIDAIKRDTEALSDNDGDYPMPEFDSATLDALDRCMNIQPPSLSIHCPVRFPFSEARSIIQRSLLAPPLLQLVDIERPLSHVDEPVDNTLGLQPFQTSPKSQGSRNTEEMVIHPTLRKKRARTDLDISHEIPPAEIAGGSLMEEWKDAGWLGPRNMFQGRPKWVFASSGYNVEHAMDASDVPQLDRSRAPSPPSTVSHKSFRAGSSLRQPSEDLPDIIIPSVKLHIPVEVAQRTEEEQEDETDLDVLLGRVTDEEAIEREIDRNAASSSNMLPEVSTFITNEKCYEASLFGTQFSSGKLEFHDSASLCKILRSLVVNPNLPQADFRLETSYLPALEKVTSIVLRHMPSRSEIRLTSQLAAHTPSGKLFPNAIHLYLKYSAQDRLISNVLKLYDSGLYKKYIRAFASMANVETLCTDYAIRARDTIELRHTMQELQGIWKGLKTHHIHIAQDDLPWTMPGIRHVVTFHPSSWPFYQPEGELQLLDYEPVEVMLENDPLPSRDIGGEEDTVKGHLWKREMNRAKRAAETNCFEVWIKSHAQVIADECLQYNKDKPMTTWAVQRPNPGPGMKRGMITAALEKLPRKVFTLLRALDDGTSRVGSNDEAAVEGLVKSVIQTRMYCGTATCGACNWSR